jgi:hypothetical protein
MWCDVMWCDGKARDRVKSERELYDAEMESKRLKEVAERNEKLKKEREALALEEEEARNKRQAQVCSFSAFYLLPSLF